MVVWLRLSCGCLVTTELWLSGYACGVVVWLPLCCGCLVTTAQSAVVACLQLTIMESCNIQTELWHVSLRDTHSAIRCADSDVSVDNVVFLPGAGACLTAAVTG